MKKFTTIISVIIFGLYLGCGLDDGKDSTSGTTMVTIHLGGPSSGKLSAQSIPPEISRIRITVSGSGMTTMEKTVDVAGQTEITVTFHVRTGRDRTILVEAFDSTGAVVYNGSTTADFAGASVTLDIALADFMPTGLSASAFSSMRIDLQWPAPTDSAGTSGYNVYRDDVKIATVAANSYSDTGLITDTRYCYTVSALNAAGSESTISGEACATTSPAAFSKTFGGMSGEIYGNSIQQTTDGGFILAGETNSFGAGGDDVFVMKLNPDGTVAWQKTYGGAGSDTANSVEQTADGGYIVAGYSLSFGAGNGDAWVLKLDPDGTVTWQKTYGGETSSDIAYSIQQTTDGGFILAGETNSFGAGGYDVWVLKLDPDGTVAWQKTYGEAGFEKANSIQQTTDGGYILAGQTYSFGAGNGDVWVLKLDPDGTIAWQKTYGGTGWDPAWSVQQTSDGSYIVAGFTNSFGAGGYDVWVLKLDPDGTIAWQKTYGGTGGDYAYSIQQTPDGGYILAGETNSMGAGGYDALLLRLNPEGTVAWQKTYGPAWDDWVYYMKQTTDGIIMTGNTCPLAGACDLWVLKTNTDGAIGCGMSADQSIAPVDTFSSPVDTTVAAVASSPTVTDTSVMPQDTAATLDTQCSGATGGPSRMQINSIVFPDTNLDTCVNTYATSQGYAYADQMTLLKCTGKGIADITGIEWFTNLTELWMYNNDISDISALSALTNLTFLYIGVNSISDISALSALTNLKFLYLDVNSISDISTLSGLTNLTELYLDRNSISDISALSALTGLKILYLYNTGISDISALSGLTSLTELDLGYNSISDVSALSGLTSINKLSLYNNIITTGVATLTGLTSATIIDLRVNPDIPCADLAILEAALPLTMIRHSLTCP